MKCLYVDIDRDKQRYPDDAEPEYVNYVYSPRPWKEGDPIPCLPGEAWFFFQNPDKCGNFKGLNGTLPVRTSDMLAFRVKAWGMYIERRFSIFPILVPTLMAALLTLGCTLCFIPLWLEEHPGDLQNATVPVMAVFTVAVFFLQILVSLLAFRWSF